MAKRQTVLTKDQFLFSGPFSASFSHAGDHEPHAARFDADISSEIAERVIQIPQLYEEGTKSTATLLQETGLWEAQSAGVQSALEVEKMEEALRQRPELIDLWLKRGMDQRIAGGWGIESGPEEFRIQNYADGRHLSTADPARAVAEFVVRYVGFIGEQREH